MQDGEEDSTFHRELEASSAEEVLNDLRNPQLFPETPKDQCGADTSGGDFGCVPLPMGADHHHGFDETSSRLQQAVELARILQAIKASQRGDDALLTSPVFPAILDDLKIHAVAGLLLTKEHGGLPAKFIVPP